MLDIDVNFSPFADGDDDSDEVDYIINQVSAKKIKEAPLPHEEPIAGLRQEVDDES